MYYKYSFVFEWESFKWLAHRSWTLIDIVWNWLVKFCNLIIMFVIHMILVCSEVSNQNNVIECKQINCKLTTCSKSWKIIWHVWYFTSNRIRDHEIRIARMHRYIHFIRYNLILTWRIGFYYDTCIIGKKSYNWPKSFSIEPKPGSKNLQYYSCFHSSKIESIIYRSIEENIGFLVLYWNYNAQLHEA